jgi:hypothetical protein
MSDFFILMFLSLKAIDFLGSGISISVGGLEVLLGWFERLSDSLQTWP